MQTATEHAKFCVQGTLRKYMSVSLDKQKCVHFQSIKIVMKRGWMAHWETREKMQSF